MEGMGSVLEKNDSANSFESTVSVSDNDGKEKFKTSHDILFYKRQRDKPASRYCASLDTLILTERGASLELYELQKGLLLQIRAVQNGTLRLTVDELDPIKARYKVAHVLTGTPKYEPMRIKWRTGDRVSLTWGPGQHEVHISASPFCLEVLCEEELMVTLNPRGRLCFETIQDTIRLSSSSHQGEEDPLGPRTLQQFQDITTNRPRSVGVDFRLHGFNHVYGLPEHADSLQLKDTSASEAYRLYNLDVFAYDIDSRLGLYGSVPLLLAHKSDTTLGVFWLNASETLVDLKYFSEHQEVGVAHYETRHPRVIVLSIYVLYLYQLTAGYCPLQSSGANFEYAKCLALLKDSPFTDVCNIPEAQKRHGCLTLYLCGEGSRVTPHTDVTWVSESGRIDCFVLLGPSPAQVFSQYAQLTGYQALPPMFSLGYHQCRWSYKDEEDVKSVDAGFDLHAIPYDVIWLDIDHTEGKRYFTWDSQHFPSPLDMQRHLQAKRRKLVVINDPHIKADPEWPLFCEARDGDHFVRNRDFQLYHGKCWPGDSCYLDFSSPRTRSWYARQFLLTNYKGSTESLFVWNDMNEPSVFSEPEKTMPKDTVHCGGWEHRDLHNLYGFFQHLATFEGLITRSGGLERPFVLSRSFFAGSQRLGAVWTGDNVATWEYLKISIPMLLSLSITGIHFCGADVGGFWQDPDAELLVRWYQAGALQPFFRGHSARGSKRREPWLFGEEVTSAVRSAVQQRYCLLPYWYTVFHQAHSSATPPIRPLWVEFPKETETFTVENQYMIGNALLVCPVTDPGVTEVKVLLPGSDEFWYDVSSGKAHDGGRTLTLPVTLESVPMFQRGGTVVPRRVGRGSCTADLQLLPLTLTVAPDTEGNADGVLYLDDGHSFSYRDRKEFWLRRFTMTAGRLISRSASEEGVFIPGCKLESVIILGQSSVKRGPTVQTNAGTAPVAYQFEQKQRMLTVTGLNLDIHTDWEIII